VKKGETLIDTAATLNAMRPDIIIVRHHAAGAVHLLARKVDCSVVNAGDGAHEHPTQALLDALTIRRNRGRIQGSSSRSAATSSIRGWRDPTSSCSGDWARESA
jgi:aspartate carbamoyltransferase catalytic subunit